MYLCFDSARVRVLQSPDIFWIILTSLPSPKTNRVIEESVALFESSLMPRNQHAIVPVLLGEEEPFCLDSCNLVSLFPA